jgi:hypothetical protein
MEPIPNKIYHHFSNDNDISWGWFVDIDNDWNTNNIRQIIRISNNLPPICEIDEEILEPDEISKNQTYFNAASITTTTLFVVVLIYILY